MQAFALRQNADAVTRSQSKAFMRDNCQFGGSSSHRDDGIRTCWLDDINGRRDTIPLVQDLKMLGSDAKNDLAPLRYGIRIDITHQSAIMATNRLYIPGAPCMMRYDERRP
jgi:hypothetical protein